MRSSPCGEGDIWVFRWRRPLEAKAAPWEVRPGTPAVASAPAGQAALEEGAAEGRESDAAGVWGPSGGGQSRSAVSAGTWRSVVAGGKGRIPVSPVVAGGKGWIPVSPVSPGSPGPCGAGAGAGHVPVTPEGWPASEGVGVFPVPPVSPAVLDVSGDFFDSTGGKKEMEVEEMEVEAGPPAAAAAASAVQPRAGTCPEDGGGPLERGWSTGPVGTSMLMPARAEVAANATTGKDGPEHGPVLGCGLPCDTLVPHGRPRRPWPCGLPCREAKGAHGSHSCHLVPLPPRLRAVQPEKEMEVEAVADRAHTGCEQCRKIKLQVQDSARRFCAGEALGVCPVIVEHMLERHLQCGSYGGCRPEWFRKGWFCPRVECPRGGSTIVAHRRGEHCPWCEQQWLFDFVEDRGRWCWACGMPQVA